MTGILIRILAEYALKSPKREKISPTEALLLPYLKVFPGVSHTNLISYVKYIAESYALDVCCVEEALAEWLRRVLLGVNEETQEVNQRMRDLLSKSKLHHLSKDMLATSKAEKNTITNL